jgi:hypothetical protein
MRATMAGDWEDGVAPNCPECLEQMEPRVGAWWCATCEVAKTSLS